MASRPHAPRTLGALLTALLHLSAAGCGDRGERPMGGDAGTGDSLASAALPGDPGAGGSEAPAIDYSILSPEELLDEAYALQERIVTIDSHADIPFDYATPSVDPCGRIALQVDLSKMEEGGLDAVFLNVWVPQGERTPAGYERAREQATTKFRAIRRLARELCPERVELALTPDDVALIARAGKLVAVIGIENGFAIGQDLSLLETYRDLGAIYMSLTHSAHNDLADSSQPRAAFGDGPSEHGGVSELGRRAIAEMNRLGMMVDVSHASRQATLDAIRLSRAPVVASHSSARTLTDHPRNLDDETLLALRDQGGVIQVVALGDYVRPPGGGTPTVSDLVDHIDHVVALIGIDHVGISSDFDGGGGIEGWSDASETVNVTAELMRRGYDEAEIAKIWGGNLLRVWRAALEVAARTP